MLVEKKIGVATSTTAEYFLEILLLLNGIQYNEIEVIDLIPSDQVKAIVEGRVDAIVVWNPYASHAKEQLGSECSYAACSEWTRRLMAPSEHRKKNEEASV